MIAFTTQYNNLKQPNTTLYLLDSVSGIILYRSVYIGAGQVMDMPSTFLIQSENWVVFTYFKLIQVTGVMDSIKV